ncbi:TIGR00266 family protein [Deltaproteobacteria bacterium]|nr:TIGR00266 family protein [Deltaproteobacteria bacterium]
MRFDIQHRPAYALAIVHLEPNETVIAEGGAMVSMDSHVQMQTSAAAPGQGLLGGLLSGLKRVVAGESFFQNRFTASAPGQVTFAPVHVGDIVVHELGAQGVLYLQSTAFLCSSDSIAVDTKWGGARTFFGGEGLVMLKATGHGPIAFNSFGGVKCIDVEGEFTVDTGHIVAFEGGLNFTVNRFGGGWKSFIFGGEGLVCRFTGTGRLWIQTRNPQEFGKALGPKLPMREN